MFRIIIAVIGVLIGIFAYYVFYPTTTSFAVQYTVYQNPFDVFHFVKNPYTLLDTCYNV